MANQTRSQADVLVAQNKVIERTSKSFVEGICSGYLSYFDEHQDKRLTDQDVYSFIIQNITDVRGTDMFNARYCTGWIEALLEDRKVLH